MQILSGMFSIDWEKNKADYYVLLSKYEITKLINDDQLIKSEIVERLKDVLKRDDHMLNTTPFVS